jgi:hypothetical protein
VKDLTIALSRVPGWKQNGTNGPTSPFIVYVLDKRGFYDNLQTRRSSDLDTQNVHYKSLIEGGLKMKKSLLVLLLAMLSFLMFAGISQAGQCIYLFSENGKNYYYDSSDVNYEGDIVSYTLYEYSCSSPTDEWDFVIDCARRMMLEEPAGDWYQIYPGSGDDTTRIRLCR